MSRLTRRSTGARSASALPSSAASSPKLASNCGASHSGKSPATCAGAPARSAAASRSRSASVSGAGAWPSPENSAAIASTSSPRNCFSAPRISARGVASPIIQADDFPPQRVVDEARDRRAVARAGEAMREAPVLHRIRRRAAAGSMSARISMAAAMRAAGIMGDASDARPALAATGRNAFIRKRKNVTGSADRSRCRARRPRLRSFQDPKSTVRPCLPRSSVFGRRTDKNSTQISRDAH